MARYSCSTCGRIHSYGEACKKRIRELSKYRRTKEEEKVYRSYQWTKARQEVIEYQQGLCFICKEKFLKDNTHKINLGKEVHHIKSVKNCLKDNEQELLYSIDNLILLCSHCHDEIHSKNLNSKDKINKHYDVDVDKRFNFEI